MVAGSAFCLYAFKCGAAPFHCELAAMAWILCLASLLRLSIHFVPNVGAFWMLMETMLWCAAGVVTELIVTTSGEASYISRAPLPA